MWCSSLIRGVKTELSRPVVKSITGNSLAPEKSSDYIKMDSRVSNGPKG